MTVHATGDIDVATVPALRALLSAEIDALPGGEIEVDLSAVTFMDSCGLGVLVGALKRARLGGGDLVVSGLTPSLERVFSVTGLNKVFRQVGVAVDDRVPA